MDFDADGHSDLLVADSNFVRALRFNRPDPGKMEGGWEVLDQVNAPRTDVSLVALEALGTNRLAAADRENGRSVIFERDGEGWEAGETITVRGFRFDDLRSGTGGSSEDLLAIGNDGFATVRLGGERTVLNEVSSWRPEDPEVPTSSGSATSTPRTRGSRVTRCRS